jgi:hypothetical protein
VWSSAINFTVVTPTVSSVTPLSATAGALVTITGTGFGVSQGSGNVWLGNTYGTVVSWSDTQVVATVASGSTSGTAQILQGGVWSDVINFTVLVPPVINSLTPAAGPIGTRVTIAGSNFGAVQGNGQVQIGNQAMIVNSWSDTSVVVTVPAEAATANIVLTADSGLPSSGSSFTVAFGGPVLQFSVVDAPLQVNLTSPQNLDWIHWGRVSTTVPDRKGGITPLISDYSVIGGTQPSSSSGNIAFSWSDGDHPPVVSETTAALEGAAAGSGFQITVPADTNAKTLNLYVEVFNGQGQLQASLSDGSAPAISDQSVSDMDVANKIYSFDFRAASAGQTLTVTFTSLSGIVGLQAATLMPHFPVVNITSPALGQSFSAPGSIPVTVSTSQFDSSVTSVQATGSDGSVLQANGSTLTTTWGPLPAGHYSITATATDNAGLSNTSSPVETDVIGQGGSLTIDENVPASPIDLDAQGTGDWVLWGPLNTGDFILNNPGNVLARKAGVAPLISDYKLIGNHPVHASVFAHNLEFASVAQNLRAQGSEIAVFGLHDGYEITVPADTTSRTLQLYVGEVSGDLNVTGFLSDGSAPVATEIGGTGPPSPSNSNSTTLYTVNYSAASAGQTLTLRLTLRSDDGGGQAVLIGAALSGPSVAPLAPAPQITAISPASAPTDTQVTISGSNFGATQSASQVLFGGFPAQVVSWGDTGIVVVVPAGVTAGQTVGVQVFSDRGDSNSVSFTALAYKIIPASLSLLVGQSRTLSVVDGSGNPVKGLGWAVSDPGIVSLSTDDPPLIKAIAAGSTKVWAGDASVPVMVYAGTSLPPGTVVWSLPLGGGAGNINLVPAVPSDSGADVFALDDSGTLTAVSADGVPVWRLAGIPGGSAAKIIPDFSGTTLLKTPFTFTDVNGITIHVTHKLQKADPKTGLKDLYIFQDPRTDLIVTTQNAVPHPEGMILVQDNLTASVIDPAGVQPSVSVTVDNSTFNGLTLMPQVGPMIVAADGNAYVPYSFEETTTATSDGPLTRTTHVARHSMLLRLSPDGTSAKTELRSWSYDQSCVPWTPPNHVNPDGAQCTANNQNPSVINTTVITNADAGAAVFTTTVLTDCTTEFFDSAAQLAIGGFDEQLTTGCGDTKAHTEAAYVAQDAVTASAQDVVVLPNDDGRLQAFVPVLQREDGSYLGTDTPPDTLFAGSQLIAVNGTTMLWNQTVGPAIDPNSTANTAPFLTPLYATAGGGAIVRSAQKNNCQSSSLQCQTVGTPTLYAVDPNGNPTLQIPDPGVTFSWKGAYRPGSVDSLVPPFDLAVIAPTFVAAAGGNLTGNGFSLRHHTFGLIFCNTGVGGDGQCPVANAPVHPEVTPMVFNYLPGVQTDSTNFKQACDFTVSSPCNNNTVHPEWTTAIKNAALDSYRTAFANLPALVANNVTADLLYGGSNNPPFGHIVYVDGDWLTSDGISAVGLTKNSSFSWVFYPSIVNGAEFVLGPYKKMPDFTPPFSDIANMLKLMTAIGTGIGNTAAHETAHQLNFTIALPGLECGPGSPIGKECQDDVNSVYESASQGQWNYVSDFNPPIHWEQVDLDSLQNFFKCNAKGCPK